jgi:hypothetical protein
MAGDERVEHLFLIRVWRERTRLQASDWRGSAQHVTTGDTLYFSRLPDLDAFIAQRLELERSSES